jgi:hypothetical protein
MAEKADGESKPNEAADPRADDLPLEDPRWVPLVTEYKRLAERLASSSLAFADLAKAVADGVIRCMWRWESHRELLPPDIWANDYKLEPGMRGGFAILPRRPSLRLHDWALFGWKPDIDKFWLRFELPPVPDQGPETNAAAIDQSALAASPESPPVEPKTKQEAGDPPSKGIPGRRPTRDWPIVVAAEVVRLVRAGALERPTSTAMIKHCEDKIKFSPPVKQMQLLLKTLWS